MPEEPFAVLWVPLPHLAGDMPEKPQMDPDAHSEFAQIPAHLSKQRASILARWRVAVDSDPKVSAVASLARAQFVDHIPRILDGFERELRARDAGDELAAESE